MENVKMDNDKGIKFSRFRVNRLNFKDNSFPESVELSSHYFSNMSKQQLSAIQLAAILTKDEATNLMRVLNDIASRVENEIRDGLIEAKS